MHRVDVKKDKALAIIMGLAYGYRGVPLEFQVLSLEEFSEEKHEEDRVYYINRKSGEVYECLKEGITHICALREDKINGKVMLFIYKNKVK